MKAIAARLSTIRKRILISGRTEHRSRGADREAFRSISGRAIGHDGERLQSAAISIATRVTFLMLSRFAPE